MFKIKAKYFIIIFISVITFLCLNCGTGVEDSPEPGIIRITLQSDPSDTILVERSDTFSVSTKYSAIFMTKVYQGRVYKDSSFVVLFPSLQSYRQEDKLYNIIELDSVRSGYKVFTIFESFVPPGNYDILEFGVSPSRDHKLKIVATNGKTFENPVELPPGEKLLMSFPIDFIIHSNKVTQIDVQVSPFKSIQRYRDLYRFYRKMNIIKVKYL